MKNEYYLINDWDVVLFFRVPSQTWAVQVRPHTDGHYERIANPVHTIEYFESGLNREDVLNKGIEYAKKHCLAKGA